MRRRANHCPGLDLVERRLAVAVADEDDDERHVAGAPLRYLGRHTQRRVGARAAARVRDLGEDGQRLLQRYVASESSAPAKCGVSTSLVRVRKSSYR